MGRMADARKKSRQRPGGGAGGDAPEGGEAPIVEAGEPASTVGTTEDAPGSTAVAGTEDRPAGATEEAGATRASDASTAWVTREESFVFPADPPVPTPDRKAQRLSLPASGLAADILALAEAAEVPDGGGFLTISAEAPVESAPARAHNISFFASPVREEKRAVEATEHLATFFLGQEEYGVDVRLVQEIIRVTDITQVPRAPAFIKGVINLRGRIIPVVDLRRKLNLGEVEITKRSRVVVVKVKDRLVGLLVDGASQVMKVPVSSIDQAPEEVVEIDANYIRGVAKLQTRLIILMDLQKILALELREGASA